MRIHFDVRPLNTELRRLGRRAGATKAARQKAGRLFLLLPVLEKIDKEGPGWPKLSDVTIRNRRGRGRGREKQRRTPDGRFAKSGGRSRFPMLNDTGKMKKSIKLTLPARGMSVFATTRYAKFHVTGTPRMPARNYLDIGMDRRAEQIAEYILGAIIGVR